MGTFLQGLGMSIGRFERPSGDAATGTCGTDKQYRQYYYLRPSFPRLFPLHFAVLVSLARVFLV